MPFDRSLPVTQPGVVGISKFDQPDPTFMQTLSAAYRQENLIGSYLADASRDLTEGEYHKVDPAYNVFDDIAGYEDYAERFETIYNQTAANAVKANIDRETRDRNTLAAAGWTGVALSAGASIVDPTIFLPGGVFAKTGRIGYSLGKSALAIGAAAGAATAIQEAGLQATQETRTAGETALNVGGSVLLGGLIGAAGARFLSKAEWNRVSDNLIEELRTEVPNPEQVTQTIVQRMQSAGAAAVDEIKLDDLGIGGGRAAQIVAQATNAARINPGIQTMFSPSTEVRKTYDQLVDNPVYTRMNMEGRSLGPGVENIVKQYDRGALAQYLESSRDLYKLAKKSGYEGTKTQFYEDVARAGRRGDIDPNGNEFVSKAAQEARAKIFDPLLERAKEAGLLPEDVKTTTAASYVTRLWNRQKLIGEEDRFREIAGNYFRQEMNKISTEQRPDFINEADMNDYIEEIVTSVFNNLTGRGSGEFPEWLVPVKRGPLKERTFNIPDALVEDFLTNDMELIARRYTRTMGAEVELAHKFGRADMKDQFEAINREYDTLSMQARTPKEREKLQASRKRDIANLTAFRDLVRGTYRAAEEGSDWSKITRAALTWNYMRLLGGVTLSSITDASRFIGVHGLRATMREALPALVSGVKSVRISKADAKALGAVTERVLQSRLSSLADLQDPYRYGSQFERFLSNASNVFSKATGLGWWNDTLKSVASVMTQNRMAKNALNWSSAGDAERAYMAFLGIDENMAERIARQIREHGVEEAGIWGANVSQWTDDVAVRSWAAALNKDVDRTIVTPGVADKPLWARTNTGKLVSQFKSFGLAANQRVLIAGLQERPHRLAEQMVFATSIGMLIGYLKYIERGDWDEANRLLENPGLWISDGLDRSGLLFLPYEISNTAEKLGSPIGITTAAQALSGDEDRGGPVSRYASRGKLGSVLGPSASLFEDLATIAEQLSKGDLKKSGANAIIRELPGAGLPLVRSAIHIGVKPELQEAVE